MKVQAVFLLLALIAAAVLCQTYENFKNQHIYDEPDAFTSCDDVIGKRKIIDPKTGGCKPINTFILAKTEEVTKICKEGENAEKNLWRSKNEFHIIECKYKQGIPHQCEYDDKEDEKEITIACNHDGLPVHFEK